MSNHAKRSHLDVSYYVDYHLVRTLKGLQDDFDRSKTPLQRQKIAHIIQELADAATFSVKVRKE